MWNEQEKRTGAYRTLVGKSEENSPLEKKIIGNSSITTQTAN